MVLTDREKCSIMISRAIGIYFMNLEDTKSSQYQSLIDCVLKNMPQDLRPELTMDLIDDVDRYISDQHVELS